MAYKVVRNAAGNLVCFGPNTNQYDPTIKTGEVLGIEDTVPASAPKSQTEIEAEIDAETDAEKSKGERADRLMLFRVLKAADPAYTKAQFRKDRRALIVLMG